MPSTPSKKLRSKTIIHVNQHVIRANKKKGEKKPVLTVKTNKTNAYAHEVEISGPCKIIYRPDKPLSCGARVWIETTSQVTIKTFDDVGHASCEAEGTTDEDFSGNLAECKA
jgi:hypothetical protein